MFEYRLHIFWHLTVYALTTYIQAAKMFNTKSYLWKICVNLSYAINIENTFFESLLNSNLIKNFK